jgi:uncharacterized membrane-anchored protein
VWWPDYLYAHFGAVLVTAVLGIALVAVLALQLSLRGYNGWIYWLAVVTVSVAGTEAANGPHLLLDLPYLICTAFYLVVLAAVLATWRASEKTLSLRSISRGRCEVCYWAAIGTAFALGRAVSNLTPAAFHPGFPQPGYPAWWAAVTALAALAWWRFGVSPVLVFWFTCVVTRPLGASIALTMAARRNDGGLGLGQWPVSVGAAIVVLSLVACMTLTRNDRPRPATTCRCSGASCPHGRAGGRRRRPRRRWPGCPPGR